jgi:prevent-host-death family protein
MERIISKSKFKPHALKYFRDVEKTGKPLIISDHGKPVVKIVPYTDNTPKILKSMRHTVIEYNEPFDPVGLDDWEALK